MKGFRSFLNSEPGRGLVWISPPFLYALALLALPLGMVLALSFWTQDFLDIDRSFSLSNYIEAWTKGRSYTNIQTEPL